MGLTGVVFRHILYSMNSKQGQYFSFLNSIRFSGVMFAMYFSYCFGYRFNNI